MSDACLAIWQWLFIICGRCIHWRKMLPQPWYMRLLLVRLTIVTVSFTMWVQPVSSLYRTCSTLQLESYCISGSSTTSPLTFEIDYIGCPFSRELSTKCVSWCTSVCIRLHQHNSLNCAHWCLNQPIVVTSVQLLRVTLQFHAPEQQDMAKDVYFAVSGLTLWNSLPLSVCDPSLTLTQFCAHLKTVLFCRAYETLA